MIDKITAEKQKLLNINDNKIGPILNAMEKETETNEKIIFVSIAHLEPQERKNLLEWYKYFGNQKYQYSISEGLDYCNLKGILKGRV